jgi:large subunit ribosomal protein L17
MRHQKRVAKLGRTASHRKALLMNLAAAIIEHGKIKTTDAKAKEVRRVVERLITYAKRGTIHHRRLAYRVLQNRDLVKTLFGHIAPQYATRNGGYTRIVKLGFRDNDSAEVSLIELVDYKLPGEKKATKPTAKPAAKKATEKQEKAEEKATKKRAKPKKAEKPEVKEVTPEQTEVSEPSPAGEVQEEQSA